MKKTLLFVLSLLILASLNFSCSKDKDDELSITTLTGAGTWNNPFKLPVGTTKANIEEVSNHPPTAPFVRYEGYFLIHFIYLVSTDEDLDNIKYGLSWNDDGTYNKWTRLQPSGEEVRVVKFGLIKRSIGAIAEDEHGARSDETSVVGIDRKLSLFSDY